MSDLTFDRLQAAFIRRGYALNPTDLHLVGIRTTPPNLTDFADQVVAAFVQPPPPPQAVGFTQWLADFGFVDAQGHPLTLSPGQEPIGSPAWEAVQSAVGRPRLLAWPATTLPGRSWPNTGRPGLLLPGHYPQAYELTPRGLCQTGAPVRCAPPGAGADAPIGPSGYFGIDLVGPTALLPPANQAVAAEALLPAAAPDPAQPDPGRPGRQMLARTGDYAKLLRLCQVFAPRQGRRFTYTLLLDQDLPPTIPAPDPA